MWFKRVFIAFFYKYDQFKSDVTFLSPQKFLLYAYLSQFWTSIKLSRALSYVDIMIVS